MENSCQMVLAREGLRQIVSEETTPVDGGKSELRRKDEALAAIVLTVDTSLLHLIGNSEDPAVIWKKLY